MLVSWRGPQPDGRVYLEWIERNGPAVQAPLRQGFGSLVITELVAQALQGTAKLDFNPDGIHWRLDIPGSFVLTEPALRHRSNDMISSQTHSDTSASLAGRGRSASWWSSCGAWR